MSRFYPFPESDFLVCEIWICDGCDGGGGGVNVATGGGALAW